MGYNRSLDLLAMSLACTQAGLPVKAAAYMHAAATDVSAAAAVDAIHAANKKKKPAKKKAKAATSIFAELGMEDDEHEDDTVASLRAALEGDEGESEEEEKAAPVSAKVRAARKALAEAEAEAEEESEEETSGAEDEADVFTMKSARRAQADTVDNPDLEVGEDLREEVPATRSKASFARALRNIAARQK
jgi:hypothetical protein